MTKSPTTLNLRAIQPMRYIYHPLRRHNGELVQRTWKFEGGELKPVYTPAKPRMVDLAGTLYLDNGTGIRKLGRAS